MQRLILGFFFYKIENDIYVLFFFFFIFFYFLFFPWINEYYFEVSPAKENLSLYVWCGLETEVCQFLLITKCMGYTGIVMFLPSNFPFFFLHELYLYHRVGVRNSKRD